ncbi:MAG: hypothetical protein K6A80_05385 [Saccharofermentans sp.]|nr:hypothetical protein [Saccharofermentans sp.]
MNGKVRTAVAIVLFVAAAALIVVGIVSGDFSDVFNKARMICYECIGIG